MTWFLIGLQIKYTREGFFKLYNGWITLQVIAGAIGFVLVIMGLLEPFFSFKELDMRPGYFFGLFTTNTYYGGGIIRSAGYFDEPGALANWGIYALLINKLFINNKKIEIILLIGLIQTLSVAYFLLATVYIFFFMKDHAKRIIPVILLSFIAIKIISLQNQALDSAIFGRLTYDETTGRFEGDNRSGLFETCYNIFTQSPVFGVGAENLIHISAQMKTFIGANLMTTFASDGLIGTFIVFLPLIYLWKSVGKYDIRYKWACIIIFLGYLQRPYDNSQLLYPLLTYSILLWGLESVKGSVIAPNQMKHMPT